MRSVNIQYYVEGEDERKLVNVLKTELKLIKPGKVQRLNVVDKKITDTMLRTLKNNTVVVIIFDTDTDSVDILNQNIDKLKSCPSVSEVIKIPQVHNLEEELVRSCKIRRITELLNSSSASEFKGDLLKVTNLDTKLVEHGFDINIFWSRNPGEPYQHIENDSAEIKIT